MESVSDNFKKTQNKKLNKSNCNCCVSGCNSVYKNNPELSFHSFPKEGQHVIEPNEFGDFVICDRRKLWEIKLKIKKKIGKHMRVCSRHFKKGDYEHAGCSLWFGKKTLLQTAVPSLNLPKSPTQWLSNKTIENNMETVTSNISKKRSLEEQLQSLVEKSVSPDDGNFYLFNTDADLDNPQPGTSGQFCSDKPSVETEENHSFKINEKQILEEHHYSLPSESLPESKYVHVDNPTDNSNNSEETLSLDSFTIKQEILDIPPEENFISATEETGNVEDMCQVNSSVSQCETQYDKNESVIFGKFVASQLKKLNSEQKRQDIICAIYKVLHSVLKA